MSSRCESKNYKTINAKISLSNSNDDTSESNITETSFSKWVRYRKETGLSNPSWIDKLRSWLLK